MYTPHAAALFDVGEDRTLRLTYADLDLRATRLAHWLRSRGVDQGSRVGMIARDGCHFYDAFFACSKLGAIFVPFNWRLHAREVEALVRKVEPSLLIIDEASNALAEHLQSIRRMPAIFPCAEIEEICDLTGDVRFPDSPLTCETLTEEDTACLLFTGGTTGLPKAAEISHRQIVWNTLNTHLADIHGTDTFLNVFPLFHTGGLFVFSIPLLILGGTVLQTRGFDADRILDLIETERVSIFAGVPTMFQMLTTSKRWEQADLGSLRFCMSGGAPMPVPLIERYQKEKGVVFRQGFGMTEFGPCVFSLSAADAVRKAGSIGKPNFFVDARVVRPGGRRVVAAGQVGELVLRGPSATTGYYGDPEATRVAFDRDGYFHTGDMARIDQDGYFYIVDRFKDMLVCGGENVYPAEVEAALYQHPQVMQCAVVGKPDEKWGEVGVAFVVVKGEISTEALLNHLANRLARFKIPKEIRLVTELPLSGAGKILKNKLREQL